MLTTRMAAMARDFNPKILVRIGTVAFTACIILAYALYPHWVTFSHFATQWYTFIPFTFAMLIAMTELWYLSDRLHGLNELKMGANALRASAVCAGLILCVPYVGNATQKGVHDLITLLFVLFAAFGFAFI